MPENLEEAVARLFKKAERLFRGTAETDITNATPAYDAALLNGIIELARGESSEKGYGLTPTLAAVYTFHASNREELLSPPPILEEFLEGRNSHWEWLELLLHGKALWGAVLEDQGIDREAFAMWSRISIRTLEDDIAEIYIEALRRRVINLRRQDPSFNIKRSLSESRKWLNKYSDVEPSKWPLAPRLIAEALATELSFGGGIRFSLPSWEAASILRAYWDEVVRAIRD